MDNTIAFAHRDAWLEATDSFVDVWIPNLNISRCYIFIYDHISSKSGSKLYMCPILPSSMSHIILLEGNMGQIRNKFKFNYRAKLMLHLDLYIIYENTRCPLIF